MATNVQPTHPQTLGQHLDAILTATGHDVSLASSGAESELSKAWTWIKGEWHNVITAVSVLYMALKTAGKL